MEENKKTRKNTNFIQMVSFLLCIFFVFVGVNNIISHPADSEYWTNTYRINKTYNVKENSVDVLIMGSSKALNAVSPLELYRQYGVSAYNASMEQQPILSTYLLLEEILKRQQPKVIFLETYRLFGKNTEVWNRKTFDGIRDVIKKFELIKNLPHGTFADSELSYLFPILKYHTRYKEIAKTDFFSIVEDDYYDIFLGFRPQYGKYNNLEPLILDNNKENYAEIESISEEYLLKIIKLCKENGIELVFFHTPGLDQNIGTHNSVQKIADENEITFIDFNVKETMENCGLDEIAYQHDEWHVNWFGAEKITNYLGEYLQENCDLPDRRGDAEFVFLEEELMKYERVKQKMYITNASDLVEYLNILCDESMNDYTMIISAKDEASKCMSEDLLDKFSEMGFKYKLSMDEAYRRGYIGIWSNGEVIYEAMSEGIDDVERDLLEYSGAFPDGIKYHIKSSGYEAANIGSIVIDGVEQSKNSRGLNIIIYDNINGRIIDSVCFDTHYDAGLTFSR